MISKFGIISNFVNIDQFWGTLGRISPNHIKRRPRHLISKLLEWTPAFKMPASIYQQSVNGQIIEGIPISCPLMAEQMITLPEDFVIEKIVESVNIAEKFGAKLAVLTGYNSVVGNQGEIVSKRVNIPITTGNSYTAALAINGVKKAVKLLDLPLKKLHVAIIGATGDIGSVCSKIIAKEVAQLSLIARNINNLDQLAEQLRNDSSANIKIFTNINEGIKNADIIISATSSVHTLINAHDLKPGAIVCDVAVPKNTANDISKKRNDVLVFDGGMVNLNQNVLTPYITKGFMTGCISEGIILSMEKKYEPYSLCRGNITPKKVDYIYNLGLKHGLDIRDLKIGDKIYTEADFAKFNNYLS